MLGEIVNHIWQSTLVAVVVALLTLLLRDNGAHVRYWLWWLASVKFLVPFSVLTAFGAELAFGTRPGFEVLQWSSAIGKFAEPVASPPWTAGTVASIGFWAAGFVAVLGYWLMRARRVARMLRGAVRVEPPLDAPSGPPVLEANVLVEPAMVGVVRPVLLLPRGIDAHLPPAQLQAVLAHELSHWRRRDNLTAAAHMLVEAVFWFHPLVWWIGARLVVERERACDEAVVRSGHDPKTYAEAVLNVCEFYLKSALPCAAGVSGADLKRRVEQIMGNRKMKKLQAGKKIGLLIVGIGMVATPLATGLLGRATASAQVVPPLLVRIAPDYPPAALAAGIEGSVTLEFSIAANGATKDIVVVESTAPSFEQPAVLALSRWRYQVQGNPVEINGVRTVMSFGGNQCNGLVPTPSRAVVCASTRND
jgi:TonB family protein